VLKDLQDRLQGQEPAVVPGESLSRPLHVVLKVRCVSVENACLSETYRDGMHGLGLHYTMGEGPAHHPKMMSLNAPGRRQRELVVAIWDTRSIPVLSAPATVQK
jgi:hypothetical protein